MKRSKKYINITKDEKKCNPNEYNCINPKFEYESEMYVMCDECFNKLSNGD